MSNTNDKKPLVSILCSAYNHERYISVALDSFLMQETDFPFEVIVHDDASTDRTAEIIRQYEQKYPDIIKPIYQTENLYRRNIKRMPFFLEKAQGKYLAICEGDDFWVSNKKLQTQIMFMEKNPEYGLTTHAAYYAREDGSYDNKKVFRNVIGSREVSTEEIMEKWMFATNSLVYRKELRQSEIPFQGDCCNGDLALVIHLALQSKVFYFDELFSAYRVNSVSSITRKWRENTELHIQTSKKLADMLARVDDYSNHKYQKTIEGHRRKVMFGIALMRRDIKEAKSYPELYAKMSARGKLSLYVWNYLPGVAKYWERIKNKLKTQK